MKLPKYVQAWVDDRDGRAYYYFRRRGFARVRLPGLPWSPSFMQRLGWAKTFLPQYRPQSMGRVC